MAPTNPLALLGMEASPEALMAARAAVLRKQAAQRPATAEEVESPGALGPSAALAPSMALAEALRNRTPNTGAYELCSGDNEGDVRQRAEGINLGLGRQRAAGNLGILTGDRVLSGFGQAQLQGADKQEGMLAAASQFRAGQTLKQALEAEKAKQDAKDDAERARHNRAMEGRAPSNIFLQGPGGQYFMAPSRGTEPPKPVTDPTTGDPLFSTKADDIRAAEIKREEEKAAKERAHEEKMGQLQVGGFTFAPERLPSPDAAKQMKDVAIQRSKIQRGVARLKDLYAQHGTELFGDKAGEMESEFTAVTTALRMMNEMGVPNGRDYEFLAKELADPTGWKDMFTSKGRNLTKLDTFSRRVNDTVSDTAEVLGYTAVPSAAPAPSAQKTPPNTLSSTKPRRAPMPSGELGDTPTQKSEGEGVVTEAMGRGYRPLNMGLPPFTANPEKMPAKAGGIYMFNPQGAAFFVKDAAIEKARSKGWKDAQ